MNEDKRTSRDAVTADDIDAIADGEAPSAQNGTPLPIAQQCVEVLPTARVDRFHSCISRSTAALCARCSRDRRSTAWADFAPPCSSRPRPYTCVLGKDPPMTPSRLDGQ